MLRKTTRIRDPLRKKALSNKKKRESDWSMYRKDQNSVNNIKKNAIPTYPDNINTYLDDSSNNNC